MSRVGKKPVSIPKGVSVTSTGNMVKIKGPKGELERSIHPNMKIQVAETEVSVLRPDDTKTNKSLS